MQPVLSPPGYHHVPLSVWPTDTADAALTEQAIAANEAVFLQTWNDAHAKWQQRWEQAFQPENTFFSGHLPSLVLEDTNEQVINWQCTLSLVLDELWKVVARYIHVYSHIPHTPNNNKSKQTLIHCRPTPPSEQKSLFFGYSGMHTCRLTDTCGSSLVKTTGVGRLYYMSILSVSSESAQCGLFTLPPL